jgi:hypothetical protein
MAAKLTRLSHKIGIRLHIVAESCTICSSRSRLPVWKFWIHSRMLIRVRQTVNVSSTARDLPAREQ